MTRSWGAGGRGWQLLAFALVVTGAAGGCGLFTGPSPSDELAAAEARWNALGWTSYEFEMVRGCFCSWPDVGQRVTVTVEGGTVARARYTATGAALDEDHAATLPTMPDLFGFIRAAILGKADRLEVEYHPQQGYPMQVSIDHIRQAVDDEQFVAVLAVRGPGA